ncbi:MAG: hypothetical protein J0H85_09055 [Sediminibacterium magnilacihabitans]|jgi:hypothetical protein|nr:hypothetical protein [Sediminibacterium magnilacihabitans]PQV60410.1 hypothetical protein CLV53_10893 [Sediminibacterium magnilacihabitans]
MHITSAHIPRIVQSLANALQDGKDWLAFDSEIQLLSVYDLNYFDSANKAADFQWFNHGQEKEVTLLPVEALLTYVRDHARDELRQGRSFSSIEIDDEKVLSYYGDVQFNYKAAELEQLMDSYDWNLVFPDLGVDSAAFENIEAKIEHSTLDYLLEQLSVVSTFNERGHEWAKQIMERHWSGGPMEKQIPDVLSGKIAPSLINHQHKTIPMTQKNLEYLQNQLKSAGFTEAVFPELEKNMREGKAVFQLQDNQTLGKDQLSFVLHFAKSSQEGNDMYFFNKYEATLKSQTIHATQTFFINNKGQSIDLREANNLLNGRSVYKEVTPKEGDRYKAWLKLDFGERDEYGNNKMQYFNQHYGFDLKDAISRLELKEMGNPEKMEDLIRSLQRGDLTAATLLKGGKEIPVQITADPKYKTLKMYGEEGSKLFVPGAKQETRYGKAPVDQKREAEGTAMKAGEQMTGHNAEETQPTKKQEQPTTLAEEGAATVNKKKDLLPPKVNEHNLLPKNRVRQGKSQGIA